MNSIKNSKCIITILLLTFFAFETHANSLRPWDHERCVWSKSPSPQWRYGFPVGNGRLGAMVQGTYPKECIQLNEDSIWAKELMLRHPASTKEIIAEAQTLVEAGKYRQAHDLYESKIIMSDAPAIGSYQTMGDLWIEHLGDSKLKQEEYFRKLDLATGVVTVTKPLTDGSVITEEVLSSAVDDCIAVRISTTSEKGLNFNVSITRPFKKVVHAVVKGKDELVLEDQARYEDSQNPHLGTKFFTVLKVLPEAGSVKGGDDVLEVRGAKAAVMLLTCSTDFNRADPHSPLKNEWQKKSVNALKKAKKRAWKKIKKDSMDDVASMMYRCDVELGLSDKNLTDMPTDKRLKAFNEKKFDPDLMELYFQFGRYLQICSSRPGTLPTNLQGIWANGIKNPWGSDYHLNINTQLHYLSTDVTNLSECHEPLFWHLNNLRTEGRKMSQSYGAKGFCTGHETNPWGRTINRARRARWSGSLMSGAWITMNVMEHYRYTQDQEFLEVTAFPILKESCEFVDSWVVRDKNTGMWVPKASTSPETGFYYLDENGQKKMSEIGPVTAYDQSIIWQVMSDYLEAAGILGINDEFTKTVKAKLAELELPRIGKSGNILEWGIEVEEVDQYHRHQSHLVGLHPGNLITKSRTPELFQAAEKSLLRRGDRTMGWSQSWKISLYARLFDGNSALGQFKKLLCEQTQPNLFNLCGGIFNLDGNYGAPAGVAEMLMQSHDGVIQLLPALADEWKDGSIRGIVARGGFEIDINWKDGKLVRADILSRHGGKLKVSYNGHAKSYDTEAGENMAVTSEILTKSSWPYAKETEAQRNERMSWWRQSRFGMFIHWGVYSVLGGVYKDKEMPGIAEWIMFDARIPGIEYKEYSKKFNPIKYDPDAWVSLAKETGMKYIVITSKHHDGFALFDSKVTDWDIVDATPYGKDLLKPLAEACRKHGIKLGFYYSQAQDWTHTGGAVAGWGGGKWDESHEGSMDDYIREIAAPQVKEILTNYGDIAVLWWDTPVDMNAERADMLQPLINLQPGIITNNRLGGGYDGDCSTPEQYIPAIGLESDWESCMTMNRSWGFSSHDQDWKTSETLIRNLVDIASKGGNYLLNVGPTAEGEIPQPSIDRLKDIGEWMKVNSESIYGTTASPFLKLGWGRCTKKEFVNGANLYLHVFDWPENGRILLPGLKNEVAQAYLLGDFTRLNTSINSDGVVVELPSKSLDEVDTVVVVKVNGKLDVEIIVPGPDENGVVSLTANEADIQNKFGTEARLEGEKGNWYVGNWTRPRSWVGWTFRVDQPGMYEVIADIAVDGETAFRVPLGKSRLKAAVSTDGLDKFEKVNLGKIEISKAGINMIRFIPVISQWKETRLRSVTLKPIK